jgi:hypothetical protein
MLLLKRFMCDLLLTPFCSNGEVLVALETASALAVIWACQWFLIFDYFHHGETVPFGKVFTAWYATALMSVIGSLFGLFLYPCRRGGSARMGV